MLEKRKQEPYGIQSWAERECDFFFFFWPGLHLAGCLGVNMITQLS